MDLMTVLMLVFIVLLCFPLVYLAFFFIRQLNLALGKNLKQKQKQRMRNDRNETRSVYHHGRPGRGR
jgi:Mg2+/Co2+ transporter CorB